MEEDVDSWADFILAFITGILGGLALAAGAAAVLMQ
jgi:hypothetical protein